MKSHCARFFLLLLLFTAATALQVRAWTLSGVVTDESGEPIPSANVYVLNSTYGVITNIKGEYFLDLKNGSYTLVFSSNGYEKQQQTVNIENAGITLNVQLNSVGYQIGEVEITAGRKDPAYAIIDSVIANKKYYVQQYESFICETYLKASLETDTLPKQNKRDTLAGGDSLAADSAHADTASADSISEAADSLVSEDPIPDTTYTDSVLAATLFGNVYPDGSDKKNKGSNGKDQRPKLNFIELFSTTYFRMPGQYKSVIHAYRDLTEKVSASGVSVSVGEPGDRSSPGPSAQITNPYLFYLDVSDADFNFYRNLIEVERLGPKPYISPVSGSAFVHYKFRLMETFEQNGKIIYKIEVSPKNPGSPLFSGVLFIVDKAWAIQSLNLEVNPQSLYLFKSFRVIQDYSPARDGRWVLDREEFFYNLREGRVRYYGNTIALYSDYKLDTVLPDRMFRNELRHVEDSALSRDSIFWVENRPVELKPEELRFIHRQDSINAVRTSAAYLHTQDSIFNRVKFWEPILEGISFRNSFKHTEIYIMPLIEQVRPFGVGGYRHAFGGSYDKEWDRAHGVHISGQLDFGIMNQDLKGYAKVGYTFLPKKFGQAYIRGGHVFDMVNKFNSITATFSRGNYVQKKYGGLGWKMEILNGLRGDIYVEFADRTSLENLDLESWSNTLFDTLNTPVEFDPYREAFLRLDLSYTPFQKYMTEPYKKVILGSDWPTFTLNYRKAIPDIKGAVIDYDYLEIGASHRFDIGTIGESRWRFATGRFLRGDSIMFTDYRFFRGSDRFWFSDPLKSFQLMGPTFSTRNTFIQGNYLHGFNGTLMNKIPGIRRLKLDEIIGGGFLYIGDQNFFHTEVFAGLGIPFRIKQQLFKLGCYFVTSYSNEFNVAASVKFGINFFNSSTNSWEY